jgi:integrase
MVTWIAQELRRFLDGVREDRLFAACVLPATSGLRRGEALGLRWTSTWSRAVLRFARH